MPVLIAMARLRREQEARRHDSRDADADCGDRDCSAESGVVRSDAILRALCVAHDVDTGIAS